VTRVLAMPEEDFIAKHAPAGDRATAEALREIYREVVEDLVEASGFT